MKPWPSELGSRTCSFSSTFMSQHPGGSNKRPEKNKSPVKKVTV